jgi:hypothetical protein
MSSRPASECVRTFTFEACSGFTHVTARRIARPPGRSLSRGFGPASCPTKLLVSFQTIDNFLVEHFSTGDTRRRGALHNVGQCEEVANAQVIDLSGKFIIPGPFDSHVLWEEYMGELYVNHGVTSVAVAMSREVKGVYERIVQLIILRNRCTTGSHKVLDPDLDTTDALVNTIRKGLPMIGIAAFHPAHTHRLEAFGSGQTRWLVRICAAGAHTSEQSRPRDDGGNFSTRASVSLRWIFRAQQKQLQSG